MLKVKKSTKKVSNLFMQLGVSEINVNNIDDDLQFIPRAAKSFLLNGNFKNLSNYSFILRDGWLFIEGNDSMRVTILNDNAYVVTPTFNGLIEDSELYTNDDFNILIFLLNEIITDNTSKIDMNLYFNENASRTNSCSFFDTWYAVGSGVSRSVSLANLATVIGFEEADGSLNNCVKIGDTDTSCLLTSHICTSTQAYCCS